MALIPLGEILVKNDFGRRKSNFKIAIDDGEAFCLIVFDLIP